MSTYIPGVKYYSVILSSDTILYYAVHPDGRRQATSSKGRWIPSEFEVSSTAVRCRRREAVNCRGEHETW